MGFPGSTVGAWVGVAVGAAVVGAELGLLVGACVGINDMVGLSVMVVTITPPTPRGGRVGASVGFSVPVFAPLFPGFESAGFVLLLLGGPFSFSPPPPPFPATITPTTTPTAAKKRTTKGMQSRRLRGLSQKVQCVLTVPSSSFPLLLLP